MFLQTGGLLEKESVVADSKDLPIRFGEGLVMEILRGMETEVNILKWNQRYIACSIKQHCRQTLNMETSKELKPREGVR